MPSFIEIDRVVYVKKKPTKKKKTNKKQTKKTNKQTNKKKTKKHKPKVLLILDYFHIKTRHGTSFEQT
jgi:hypothetical protein